MAALPGVLLVEGPGDVYFVQQVCNTHGIDNRRLFDITYRKPEGDGHQKSEGSLTSGWKGVKDALPVSLKTAPTRVAALFDADGDPRSRWASMTATLRSDYPEIPREPVDGGFVVRPSPERRGLALWMMPNNQDRGELEDFFAGLIPLEDPLHRRAREVVSDLPRPVLFGSDVRKAEVHTWLAWRKEPGRSMGRAVSAGDVQPRHPNMMHFVAWLRRALVD
jgi:hypothetical protein